MTVHVEEDTHPARVDEGDAVEIDAGIAGARQRQEFSGDQADGVGVDLADDEQAVAADLDVERSSGTGHEVTIYGPEKSSPEWVMGSPERVNHGRGPCSARYDAGDVPTVRRKWRLKALWS